MNELIEMIMQHIAIWAPSLTSILGVVTTVILAVNKSKDAIESIKSNTDFKEIKERLKKLSLENEELARTNKLLLEQITKIKDYADIKKRTEE